MGFITYSDWFSSLRVGCKMSNLTVSDMVGVIKQLEVIHKTEVVFKLYNDGSGCFITDFDEQNELAAWCSEGDMENTIINLLSLREQAKSVIIKSYLKGVK